MKHFIGPGNVGNSFAAGMLFSEKYAVVTVANEHEMRYFWISPSFSATLLDSTHVVFRLLPRWVCRRLSATGSC